MTEIGQYLRTIFTMQIATILNTILLHLPLILGGMIVLGVGLVVAMIVRRLAAHLFRAVGVDVILSRAGIGGDESKPILRPSGLLARILYWTIVFTVVMTVFDMLGLEAASYLLRRMLEWIPRMLLVMALLTLGLYVSNVLADAAERIAASARLQSARAIGLAVRMALLVLVVLTIMQQLGIGVEGLVNVFLVVLSTLAVAAGLALGLGGRELVSDLLAGQALRTMLVPGRELVWESRSVTVRRVRATHTELQAGDRLIMVPNSQLANRVMELNRP